MNICGWCTNKVLNINYYFYEAILISLSQQSLLKQNNLNAVGVLPSSVL